MKAAVQHGRRDVRIEEVPQPEIGPGELLVRTAIAGICGTDAHEYAHGPNMFPIANKHPVSGHQGPMIPGHEFSGFVEKVGPDVTGFRVGDLIVSGAGISCGDCKWCVSQRTNLCAMYFTIGLHRDGALAEYVNVPASTCVKANDYGLDPDVAALGQPMSIAVHAYRRSRLQTGETAVIIGAGGIGAFLTFVVAQAGGWLLTTDVDASRLEIAQKLGATAVVDPRQQGAMAEFQQDPMEFVNVIFEVSGTESGMALALDLATRGTRIVLVGLHSAPYSLDLRDISLREIEIIGTNAHVVAVDLPEALRLLSLRSEGWADVAPEVLSLSDLISHGLEPLADRQSVRIKTLIDPWAQVTRPTQSQGVTL